LCAEGFDLLVGTGVNVVGTCEVCTGLVLSTSVVGTRTAVVEGLGFVLTGISVEKVEEELEEEIDDVDREVVEAEREVGTLVVVGTGREEEELELELEVKVVEDRGLVLTGTDVEVAVTELEDMGCTVVGTKVETFVVGETGPDEEVEG
jgi:hypothetical protein